MRIVLIAAVAALAPALACAEGFGPDIDDWSFSRADEGKSVFNCRATRRASGREDILAGRTNLSVYLSVKAEGMRGKFPGTIVWPLNAPKSARSWTVKAEANGARLWFPMPDAAAAEIVAEAGGYAFAFGGSPETGQVVLGKSAAAAWGRVRDCVGK